MLLKDDIQRSINFHYLVQLTVVQHSQVMQSVPVQTQQIGFIQQWRVIPSPLITAQ